MLGFWNPGLGIVHPSVSIAEWAGLNRAGDVTRGGLVRSPDNIGFAGLTRKGFEMPLEVSPTTLIDQAAAELGPALAAIAMSGDVVITESLAALKEIITEVNGSARSALLEAEGLHTTDERNPAWKARQLAELPARLAAATTERLIVADKALQAVADAHLNAVINPPLPEGTGIREELRRVEANTMMLEELRNRVEGIQPESAALELVRLASEPRFAALMAGGLGDAYAYRFRLKDTGLLRGAALRTLKESGSAAQKRHLAALDEIGKAKRVIGLSREGVQTVAAATQIPPTAAPSGALR